MRFGLDKNGKKIRPSETGDRATCKMCGGILIAHCGDIRPKHWQHKSKKDCDSWKGEETDWHLNWKAKFPQKSQEVVITKNGDTHRADVKTKEGIVLEFQNSSISYSDIEKREEFYGNMLWVVNAEDFKSHFDIHSIVLSKLRRLKDKYRFKVSKLKNEYDEELKSLKKEIDQTKALGKQKSRLIKENRKEIQKLKSHLENIDDLSKTIIESWSADSFLGLPSISYSIDSKYRVAVKKISKEIKEMKEKKQIIQDNLQIISKLEDYELNGDKYKIVKYSQINSPKNYTKVKAVKKESKDTLWPEIKSIESKAQFKSFSYKKDNFIFIIDHTEKEKKLKDDNRDLENEIISKRNSLKELQKKIKDSLIESINSKIIELKKENNSLESEWDELISKKGDLSKEKSVKKYYREEKIETAKQKLNKQKETEKSEVMRENKGLYTYEWKNERKSWSGADCPIFFDFGEGYLFKKVNDTKFKKISINDFLSRYANY